MYKIKMILADYDSRYVDKVADYINSIYSTRIRVLSFTRVDLLEEYLKTSGGKYDVLLAHPDFFRLSPEVSEGIELMVALSDESINSYEDGYKSINKYLPGDRLVGKLIDIYSGKNCRASEVVAGIKNSELVCVYSPAGGVGKTSIAAGLAAQLSDTGQSVIILSLENINSLSACLPCTGNNALPHLLLALSEDPQLVPVKVEAYKTRDPLHGFDFLEPPDCFTDLIEINCSETQQLLNSIKQAGKFDVIIVDMDAKADAQALAVFGSSDRIIFVHAPDAVCTYKTEAFFHQIMLAGMAEQTGLFKKIIPVINKYTGEPSGILNKYGLETKFSVPVFSNLWLYRNGMCVFDSDRSFCHSMAGVARTIIRKEPKEDV